VFTIVGASFGPICGAMTADYLLSGKRWAGPRQGINWAGYIAWALGFVVGIVSFLPVSAELKSCAQPAVVYSYLIGSWSTCCWPKLGWNRKPCLSSGLSASGAASWPWS